VASSSPACSKYRLQFTRPVGSEILRNFEFLLIFGIVISQILFIRKNLFIHFYPNISNSNKTRLHTVLKNDPCFD